MAQRRELSDGSTYQKTVLKNGLRIVTEKIPSVRSVSLGVWVDVGARNESPKENGITHLIEHMLFKGTKNRNAHQIAAEIENVGGFLNAFTSREHTCYLVRVMYDYLETAVDVLADLAQNATLTVNNLAKEKKVICEEIKESLESPADHVHDLFARTFWGDHPLGQPILGSIETVTQMPRRNLLEYIKLNYKNQSAVIAASGAVSHNKLVKLVREKFHFADGAMEPSLPAKRSRKKCISHAPDGISQTHVCIGFPGVKYNDRERTVALALSTHLGGGMSSVLFQKIREQKGLAYTVYTYHETYRDAGIFGAYLATDSGGLEEALSIMLGEFDRLKKRRLSKTRLDQIKAQLKGNITLGMESTSARMNRLARQELVLGSYLTLDETLNGIDSITHTDIQELANRVFDRSQIAIAVKGPAEQDVLDNVA